jgi:excisionase family DNA binding protein
MALFPPASERFAEGQPPARVSELAGILGCSTSYIYKLIHSGAVDYGRVGADYRIPVQEARRLAREAGIIPR